MLGWFIAWLQRFVQLGLQLAFELIAGILRAPLEKPLGPSVRRGTAEEVLDLRHRVLRQGQPRETARFPGDEAPDTRHWVAVQGGRVVGVVSVMRAPSPEPLSGLVPAWQLRGMAVDPDLRGQDLGRALLLATHREVGEPMWCNAREGVVGFYERHGWRAVGEPFDVPPIGPHRKMVWAG